MIRDNNGRPINTMEDWAEIFAAGNKIIHWQEGRSAYSIADYVTNHHGLEKIKSRVEEVLGEIIKIDHAIPEVEIRFDDYGQGRVHDLGIYGENKSIFIGVESKVDELFGNTILDAYLDASIKNIGGESTKAPNRIEDLLALHYGKPDKSVFNLRYQLLYSTVGTIEATYEKSVLYIIVFKTHSYDDIKGIDNYRDYLSFLNSLQAEELPCTRQDSMVHKVIIGGKDLYTIYEQIIWKP